MSKNIKIIMIITLGFIIVSTVLYFWCKEIANRETKIDKAITEIFK